MIEHKTLLEALLAFKEDAPTLPKDKVNPHFKSRFTSLDMIAERIDPLLVKHGLVWTALPGHADGRPTLAYQLAHAASGELLSGEMPLLLDRENSQGLGSALTYARRYVKVAVLDLVTEEDDDGQAASTPPRPVAVAQPSNGSERAATAKQRGLIFARADEAGLSNSGLANAVLVAAGDEPREFESEDQAGAWLKRSMDRLPARLVDRVLESIGVAA